MPVAYESPFENPLIGDVKNPFKDNCFSALDDFKNNLEGLMITESKEKSFTAFLQASFGLGKTSFIDMLG